MVLDLKTVSVNSKPGSHTQLTYRESEFVWVKEIEMHLTEEDWSLDSNSLEFDVEEYQRLQVSVKSQWEISWIPELYEYKQEGKKHIWKYSHMQHLVDHKHRNYQENVRDFGKYFLGELVPFILDYYRKNDQYFFHVDPGQGNFLITKNGFCLLEPNNWQWVTEDKFNRIVRYAIAKTIK